MSAQHHGNGVSDKRHDLLRKLHEGIVELRFDRRFCITAKSPLFYVSHHADNFGLHIELREIDVFADGIFIGEIGARKNVVNVDDHGSVLIVLRRDEPATLEDGSHGLLEASFDEIKHRLGHLIVSGGLRPALDPEGQRGVMDHGT